MDAALHSSFGDAYARWLHRRWLMRLAGALAAVSWVFVLVLPLPGVLGLTTFWTMICAPVVLGTILGFELAANRNRRFAPS